MINVSMTQDDRIKTGDLKWKGLVIALLIRRPALEHATIKQDPFATNNQQMTGSRHFTRSPIDDQFHQ